MRRRHRGVLHGGPRRVGLNALFLEPGVVGGTETYVRRLVPELGRAAPGVAFVLYLAREAAATAWDLPPNVRVAAAPVSARSRPARLAWELTGLVARARRDRVDVLHSLGTTSPLLAPVPRVVTVHDLIFEAYPEAFPGVRARVLRALVPAMARRAERVIAISEATRADLARRYGVDPGRIDVVPLGPGRPPEPLPAERAAALRRAVGAGDGHLLAVATTQPHKNLDALVRAFARMRGRRPDLRLVLVGAAGTADAGLRRLVAAAGVADGVVAAGRVDDATLDALYEGAALFVHPSLYEGFGLPLLEAMARGVPVVSSGETSLPEVGGPAAAYVDARSPDAIADACEALLDDPARRAEMAEAGRRRAAGFTWARTAAGTLDAHRAALEGGA